jgi:hypothetical protein
VAASFLVVAPPAASRALRIMRGAMPDRLPDDPPLTQLLRRAAGGEAGAAEEVLPIVYGELRRIARARMAGERADHTLQATALVHEVWLKVVGPTKGRGAIARLLPRGGGRDAPHPDRPRAPPAPAQARRRPPDHASSRSTTSPASAPTRGKRTACCSSTKNSNGSPPWTRVPATVVRLRFFAGLEIAEVAKLLDLSERTVQREWEFARATCSPPMSDPEDDARA